jgi:ribokinase
VNIPVAVAPVAMENEASDVICLASWNADLVSRVPRPIARGETLKARSFTIGPGGKGSNAAIACARQGARVAVIARIGNDDFGRMALDLWAREGVDASMVEVIDGEPSGVAQILVYDDGDNSIAVAPGAGAGLGASQADAAAARLREARVVMASCEVPLAATTAAFAHARRGGSLTLLNPAPAQPLADELLALCDLLTPNESELRLLADLPAEAPPGEAAEVLLGRGAGAVAVTLGATGCALFRRGQPPLHIAGYTMRVADTIGAGDTFTGALAAAIARGAPLDEALAWANAAAALSVTGAGAIGGMPTLEAVSAQLAATDRHPRG